MIRFLIPLILICSHASSQDDAVDPRRLDSLKHSIEYNRKTIRAEQEMILKKQDSLLRAALNNIRINDTVNQATQPVKDSNKRKASGYKLYLAPVLILVIVIILMIILLRKKNSSFSRPPGS